MAVIDCIMTINPRRSRICQRLWEVGGSCVLEGGNGMAKLGKRVGGVLAGDGCGCGCGWIYWLCVDMVEAEQLLEAGGGGAQPARDERGRVGLQ